MVENRHVSILNAHWRICLEGYEQSSRYMEDEKSQTEK